MNKSEFKAWYCVVVGVASIIDGLTMVLSLGYFHTNLTLKVCFYGATKNIYKASHSKGGGVNNLK